MPDYDKICGRKLPAQVARQVDIQSQGNYSIKIIFMPFSYTQTYLIIRIDDLYQYDLEQLIINWIQEGILPDAKE